jgi:hypothetical protein
MRIRLPSILFIVLTVVIAAALTAQHRATLRLMREVRGAQAQADERARLWAKHEALAAQQISAAELERLRSDHAALPRLKSEIDAARQHTAELERAATPKAPVALTPAAEWKSAGFTTTPAAAVETLLWASSHRDLSTLAAGFVLEPAAQTKVDEMWAGLPAFGQEKFGSAAHMIASLLAQDGAAIAYMGIESQREVDADTTSVKARVENSDHQGKTETFELRRIDGIWHLVVPQRALDRYSRSLAAQR